MAIINLKAAGIAGQTDLFSMFDIGQPKPEPEDVSASEEEDEADDAASDDEGDDDVKPAKPKTKPAAKPAAKKDLTGPVKVIGCGWNAEIGEEGKKYSGKDIAKLLFEQGYKEVACANLKSKDNTVYVLTQGKGAKDTYSVKDGVTIILGQAACTLSAEQCGVEPEDFTLFDAAEKFSSMVPEFAGCGLKFSAAAKVAVPVFDKKVEAKKLDPNKEYSIWNSDGVKTLTGSEVATFYEGYEIYEGGNGTLFAQPAEPKGTGIGYIGTVDPEDLGLKKTKEVEVEERYKLPMKVCLANYNQVMEVTSEQFGGKEYVKKDDVINFLRPTYRAFRSTSRKFDFCYNKQTSELSVMIMSGEKGAATFSTVGEEGVRVERTPLGIFRGKTKDGEVCSLDFTFQMKKIPVNLLMAIIAFFKQDLTQEAMVQIWYNADRGYYITYPEARTSKVSVSYTLTRPIPGDTLVMTVHSHNTMAARFSRVDDEDEVYTGLFGVIGRLSRHAVEMSFRAGMEGCFKTLLMGDLFGEAAA